MLAGVNGAGKSTVLGQRLHDADLDFYNPDVVAGAIRAHRPATPLARANKVAWSRGVAALTDAIDHERSFAIETTLAGTTILDQLVRAAALGYRVSVMYIGLDGVDRHIQRVAERRAHRGHHIPEADIRRRYLQSPRNLTTLIPHLTDLVVFDNTTDTPTPNPVELARVEDRVLIHCTDPVNAPDWATAILGTARTAFPN